MPTLRVFILAAIMSLASLAAAAVADADTRSAPLQVSVTVTRPCQVAASGESLSVACAGSTPAAVQVTIGDGEPTLATSSPTAPDGDRTSRGDGGVVGSRTVTVHF